MSEEPTTESIFEYPNVIAVLNRLTEMVSEGFVMPFSSAVRINRDEALALLESARSFLPDDVVAAENLINQANTVLHQAQEEADYTRNQAQTEADKVVADAQEFQASTQHNAQQTAEQIIADAKAQADQIVNDAHNQAAAELTQARAQAEELISQQNVYREATQRAQETENNAAEQANALYLKSNEYADERMAELEDLLDRMLNEVQNGREELARRAQQF